MAKNSITDYSKTAASNTDIQSVDIAEGCLPSGINNAIREIMADLAAMNDGTVTLTSPAFTSVDINGGTIDGVTIGGASAGAGTFTTGQFNTSLNVDGTVTADGVELSGTSVNLTLFETDQTDLNTRFRQTAGDIYIQTIVDDSSSAKSRLGIDHATGDIFFYEDTGTTAKLFWDASAETLGIGTTSPTADLTVTNGSSGGTLSIGNNAAGSTSVRYLQFGESSDYSIQSNANSYMRFYAEGSERMRIDSSGNVGIGNSSPTYKLDVLDNSSGSVITRIKNSNAGTGARAGIFLDNDGGNLMSLYATSSTYTGVSSWTDAGVISTSSTAAGGLIFNSQSSGGIKFQTSLAERMRIDSSGNVGIGTTSPDSKFVVSEGASATGLEINPLDASERIDIYGFDRGSSVYRDLRFIADEFRIETGTSSATERMRIDSSGRLLVGTTTNNGANAGTIIAGDTVATAGAVALQVTYTTDDSLVNYGSQYSSGDALIGHGVASSQTAADTFISTADNAAFARGALLVGDLLRFYNASAQTTTKGSAVSMTERMRIDSSGNVHIATGGSQAGATVSGTSIRSLDILKSTNTTSGFNQIVFYNPNGAVGTIRTTGSSTAYNTSSDYRLKENVTGITDGIERVKQLNPSRFNFIADADTTVDGFLAHEAATVVPEAVTGEKDAVDEDGNPEYQGIDQAKLVPLLTAALQEAITKIEDLEARVATLEGN